MAEKRTENRVRRSKAAVDRAIVWVLLNMIDTLITTVQEYIADSDTYPENWTPKLKYIRAQQKAAREHFKIKIKL